MKNTAGRVRDQDPAVSAHEELGEWRIGPFWNERIYSTQSCKEIFLKGRWKKKVSNSNASQTRDLIGHSESF